MSSTDHRPAKPSMNCPMCNNKTMSAHCTNRGCRWFECRDSGCNATLDPNRKIGHYYDPAGEKITHGKGAGMVKRIRLMLVGNRWVARDNQDR